MWVYLCIIEHANFVVRKWKQNKTDWCYNCTTVMSRFLCGSKKREGTPQKGQKKMCNGHLSINVYSTVKDICLSQWTGIKAVNYDKVMHWSLKFNSPWKIPSTSSVSKSRIREITGTEWQFLFVCAPVFLLCVSVLALWVWENFMPLYFKLIKLQVL